MTENSVNIDINDLIIIKGRPRIKMRFLFPSSIDKTKNGLAGECPDRLIIYWSCDWGIYGFKRHIMNFDYNCTERKINYRSINLRREKCWRAPRELVTRSDINPGSNRTVCHSFVVEKELLLATATTCQQPRRTETPTHRVLRASFGSNFSCCCCCPAYTAFF